eukprot:CAMPEP_0197054606 /NCGR_PEP_ID=MMETSP1384-20130603/45634_1 /TAXON_ID=29189 /ORGANISM="Ammonia sp." /LENGTH=244 /DNA_ID=CAMNT_0042487845 /DNA_START=30 /DNA_END=764 /DNA_ORIENTATION=+
MSSQQNLRNRKQNKNKSSSSIKTQAKSPRDRDTRKSPSSTVSTHNAWPSSFIVLIILSLIAYNELHFNIPSITGSVSPKKPYKDIDAFYPYYLAEHTNPDCQRLHVFGTTAIVLITLIKPEIAITGIIALLSGYIAFPLFRGFEYGALEAVSMFVIAAIISHRHGIKKYLVLVALIGYGCAWIGHFFFEKNKPATFIYPSYSLVCDFKMFGAFYKQLLNTNNWEVLWEKGIDFNEALGRNMLES